MTGLRRQSQDVCGTVALGTSGQGRPPIDRDRESRFGTGRRAREFARYAGCVIAGFRHRVPEGPTGPTLRARQGSAFFGRDRACLAALDEARSHCHLTRLFAAPFRAKCDKLALGSFLLANSGLMAYDQGVMSLTEAISSASDCPGRKRLSKLEGRDTRRTSRRHCAAHAVPEPQAMRETTRNVRVRRICTAWGVGHPDEP